jgi:NDP-sugar pyrophosphorylase family protein
VVAVAKAHAATSAMVTMALMPNRDPERYGGVRMGDDGQVSGFVSRGAQAAGSYHFFGVQVADADVFSGLNDGDLVNSLALYDALIASKPGSVRGYLCEAAFWDIGTPEDYAATDAEFARSRT